MVKFYQFIFIPKNILYFRTEQNAHVKWGGGRGVGIVFTTLYYFMITKLKLFHNCRKRSNLQWSTLVKHNNSKEYKDSMECAHIRRQLYDAPDPILLWVNINKQTCFLVLFLVRNRLNLTLRN